MESDQKLRINTTILERKHLSNEIINEILRDLSDAIRVHEQEINRAQENIIEANHRIKVAENKILDLTLTHERLALLVLDNI